MANIRIRDHREYQKYLDGAGEVFAKYNGEYLAVDEKPELMEGKWDYTKAVLIRFDTPDDFRAWYHSEEYGKILKHRLKASDCDSILLHGISSKE
jgi:uncharacterized protein (DUF1330 family)